MGTFSALKKVLVLAFLIPLPFVWRLFAGERFYPHTPLLPLLGELPPWLDTLCFSGMVLLLGAIYLRPNPRRAIGAFLVLSLVFSLWDQSRWMPYFYQFYFMFFALYALRWDHPDEDERERVANTLRIINLPIWLWSGLHKISAVYIAVGYPWMLRPLLRFVPAEYHASILSTALLSPLVEAGGAILLLFPATRKFGVILLSLMHGVILILFGPFGLNWNPSVWSWNVAMICFVFLLFYKSRAPALDILLGSGRKLSDKVVHLFVMILFLVMPIFNYSGYWDDFLSHCLYSWTTREAEIAVPPQSAKFLPEEVLKSMHKDQDPHLVSVLDWSFEVFNSPPYHSYRVFHSIFGKICAAAGGNQGFEFRIFEKPAALTGRTEIISYRCAPDLGPRALREFDRRLR